MELKPTCRTDYTLKYDIPRNGDVVQSITITAASESVDVILFVGDTVAHTASVPAHQTIVLPTIVNMLRIGYHVACMKISVPNGSFGAKEPSVTATFKLFDDDFRHGLARLDKWWW
jgi:hypothetical protein